MIKLLLAVIWILKMIAKLFLDQIKFYFYKFTEYLIKDKF